MFYQKIFQTNDSNDDNNTEIIHFLHSGKDNTGHYDFLVLKTHSLNNQAELKKNNFIEKTNHLISNVKKK